MKTQSRDRLLQALHDRFEKNTHRHQVVVWNNVLARLEAAPAALQQLGEFDLKTSSWIATPYEVRAVDGALFCDRRYGKVFVYHNGVQSYYAARGFRGQLLV